MTGRDRTSNTKLNQIIQIIIQSRISVNPIYNRGTGQPKVNKWFNIELEEVDNFREDLRLWRLADAEAGEVPPLVVETYLDLSHLGPQQTLVQLSESGQGLTVPKGRGEVVLERWVIEFSKEPTTAAAAFGQEQQQIGLPVVYKQAIILLRSLYAYTRLISSWKLKTRLSRAKLNVTPVSIGCRILNGLNPISSKGRVGLTKTISETKESQGSHLETFEFTPVHTSTGMMRISVSYRMNTDFRVSDSEALLSTHFLKMDQAGSSPQSSFFQKTRNSIDSGSSGSYASQLRKASIRTSGDEKIIESSTPPAYIASKTATNASSTSISVGSNGIPTTNTTTDTTKIPAKPAVSFIQPFKSPSLSYSPSENNFGYSGAAGSSPRSTSFHRIPSNSSLAALRAPRRPSNGSTSSANSYAKSTYNASTLPEAVISSSVSSASSIPKYSSSFGSRGQWPKVSSVSSTRRPQSFMGDASSLGSNASSESLMEPGSGLYLPGNDIGDFVKMLDSTKNYDLRQNRATSRSPSLNFSTTHSGDSYTNPLKGGSNPLARFQLLKSTHNTLSDSLQSSTYITKPTDSPPTSATTYSSSGTTQSPTTSSSPHTRGVQHHIPIIPSRLSEEFTAQNITNDKNVTTIGSSSSSSRRQPYFKPSFDQDRSYASPSSPLDIPNNSYTKPRTESMSVSNRRTSGYEDMHANVEIESHHHSLSKDMKYMKPRSNSIRNRLSYYIQEDDSTDKIISKSQQAQTFDDDDLLFAMSDMHMTNTPSRPDHISTPWDGNYET